MLHLIASLAATMMMQSAGGLVFLGGDMQQVQLIEPASVRAEGEFVRYDMVTVMAAPEPFYGGRVTRAKRFFYRADCATRSFHPTGFALLDGSGAVLADHSRGGPAAGMVRATPGTVGARAVTLACGGAIDSEPGDHFADVPAAIAAAYALFNR